MKRIDHELLASFAEESALRLTRIADKLELLAGTRPVDMELLHSIFRDTHSLKSAANLLTLGAVEQIAHKLEDILESLRSGQDLPDEQLIDILSAGYTRIEQLLKNTHVLPLIDPGKEIAVIDARLRARSSSGRR